MSDVNEQSTSRTRNVPQQVRTQRLEAFSDGVFAIAITLLVLELSVPESSHENPLGAFIGQWPSYLAYLVSFSTIGALWLGHTLMTEYLEQADAALMRLNLLLLLVVAFLPFPTRLLVEYSHSFEAERVATTIYGLTLLMATSLLSLVWRYALNEHLVRPDAADRELTALTVRLTPGLAGYVILIALGLFQPKLAVV
ncbi:MAG TPA: TMEM175 family protein, partial [Ktedonobacterales bacterium]